MKPHSLLVMFSGEEIRKTNDEYYPFFADRNFVYLTGLQSENFIFMAVKDGTGVRETLFILPRLLLFSALSNLIVCRGGIVRFCDIAEAGNIGFQHTFDPRTAGETLDILTGIDRSDQHIGDYVGYFGTPPQNVASASSILDYSDYGNVGVCNGEAPAEGDTFTQQIVYVGNTQAVGNDRHEIYIDGSGVSHTYQENDGQGGTVSKTYTEPEYIAVLTNYATAALLKHMNPLTIKLEARNTVPVYGIDYEMGDTMPIIIKEIGLRAKATVTAVKLIYEESGKSMELTFSNFKLLD